MNQLEEKLHFKSDKRIKFVGTVYDQELLKKIRENEMCIRDRYYYDESGNPVQNEWVEQYYYIGEDGKMVRNQYVDRFFVSQYGNWNPRFEAPYWLMHGEWKKNGNVWIYQYNGCLLYTSAIQS